MLRSLENRLSLAFVLSLIAIPSSGLADTIVPIRTLVPATSPGNDLRRIDELFGVGVAFSGDKILVGADLKSAAVNESAFLFDFPTGDFDSLVMEPVNTGLPGDPVVSAVTLEDFGASVSANGEILLIGARNARIGINTDRGAAYVFEENNDQYELLREVTVAGTSKDQFGSSVAVQGDGKAVVGAPGVDDSMGTEAGTGFPLFGHGSAYVYSDIRQSNVAPVVLTAGTDRRNSDEFGTAVALTNDQIVVGAPGRIEVPGRVYVFDSSGTRQFLLTSGEAGDSFGFSVDIDGDFLAVGAPLANAPGIDNSGAVYVYDLSSLNNAVCDASSGCPPLAKFQNANGMSLDLFGGAVAADGDRVLVGAPLARRDPNDLLVGGTAYLYDVSAGLAPIEELVFDSTQFGDAFGISVDLSGNSAVVGASQTEEACTGVPNCTNTGSAYLFNLSQLQAGDAQQDFDFDQLDLVKVQIAAKYLTGQPATWGDGDWNGAPGGRRGSPPAGDGLFSQPDIIAALNPAHYLTGPYASLSDGNNAEQDETLRTTDESKVKLVYDAKNGNLSVEAPPGRELTSIHLKSSSRYLAGERPHVLEGTFDTFDRDGVFKATFGGSFASADFGRLIPSQLLSDELLADLSVQGTWRDGGSFEEYSLALVALPEPQTLALMGFSIACVFVTRQNRFRQHMGRRSVLSMFIILLALDGRLNPTYAVDPNDPGSVATIVVELDYTKKCDESAETCARIVVEEDRFQRFFNNGFKVLIDPPALREALLSVQYEPSRVELSGVRYLGGFEQAAPPEISDGVLRVHARAAIGSPPQFGENVNFVELFFDDLDPRRPPSDASFSVFAGPGDFLDLLAEDGTPLPRLAGGQIIPAIDVRVGDRIGLIPDGEVGDRFPSIAYSRLSGELAIDLPPGMNLNAINIASQSGIFTGDAAQNLGGNFDVDEDNDIFKTVFDGVGFTSLSFGNVAQTLLDRDFLLTDLEVRASLGGNATGPAGEFDLAYITNPEPTSSIILLAGVFILLARRFDRRRANLST